MSTLFKLAPPAVCCACICFATLVSAALQLPQAHAPRAPAFTVSYTGVDYTTPSSGYTGCGNWTWLQARCYTNTSLTDYHISPQQLFASDMSYLQHQRLGAFQKVWVSLDELMNWKRGTGYQGYNRRALANVDDMLAHAHQFGQKIDLVLLSYTDDVRAAYSMRPEALDGHHARMRSNYLKAVHDFIVHVAANRTDAATIAVMDLQNEAYYQLEQYFGAGTTNTRRLGSWNYSEPSDMTRCMIPGNTVCTGGSAGHGCVTDHGRVDSGCVDVNIIYPWVHDLYTTATRTSSAFNYTVSDTGRLLTTDTSRYESQSWWESLYPVDVYDVHLYDDTPWTSGARWATGLRLPKPWFASEAGCAIGHNDCTYNGDNARAVDHYWLANMSSDGTSAVLIEDRSAVWNTPGGTTSRQVTPTGRDVSSFSAVIFSNSFGGQGTGALLTGNANSQFTGVSDASRVTVGTAGHANSYKQGALYNERDVLICSVAGGGTSYAYKQYARNRQDTVHVLSFTVRLGADFKLPDNEWIVLARTQPVSTSIDGKVDLTMAPDGQLYLSVFDAKGKRSYIWASSKGLSPSGWHTIRIRESVSRTRGSLALWLDGRQIAHQGHIHFGATPVHYIAVGNVSTPDDSATAGHLYIDDVVTAA